MGVETTTSVTITCDNPNCPGNSLDPADYGGWIQLVASVAPESSPAGLVFPPFPTQSTQIYCCAACAGTIEDPLQAAEDARNAAPEPEA